MADTDNLQISDTSASTNVQPSPNAEALLTIAKDDDAEAYIQFRTDQEAEESGEKATDDRLSRVEQALEEARARTKEAREQSNGLDQEYQQAEAEWLAQQQQEEQAQLQQAQQLSYHEARGRCMERGAQLAKSNPEIHSKITQNLTALESVLSEEQQAALEMALVHYTDAAWNLGLKLSDDSDGMSMVEKMEAVRNSTPQQILQAAAQGVAQLQQERYVQSRIMRDRVERGRSMTKAPPPIHPVRGSANPPKDLHQLAKKDDGTDYIKMRRAQMAREENR